jgi:uncharacterized membrane protein (DUF485 family)
MTNTTVPPNSASDRVAATRRVAAQRWRIAAVLTSTMVVVYFGFIALVAFRPDLLARLVTEGLSIGIVLGALVILAAWLLTYVYVYWANRHYDPALAALRRAQGAAADAASATGEAAS